MLRSNEKFLQCGHCGLTVSNYQHEYYNFKELLDHHARRVGYKDICDKCGTRADSFINYYGMKKQKDLEALHRYLISGILPMRQYSMLINAGYY